MEQFDVAVIGGGPGGYIAAIRCAQLGKKTALIESRDLGGTCLNRGCIPTKALLHTAELYDEVKNHGPELGLLAGEVGFDYAALAARKDSVVAKLRRGIEGLVKGRKITLVKGSAAFTGPGILAVTDSPGGAEHSGAGRRVTEYRAGDIIIATGSEPASVPVPGAELPVVLNSDGVLSLTAIPDSAVIIGGGVIGIEFATLFNSLGKKITIIEMLPGILNGMDQSICAAMTKLLTKRGVEIHTGAKVLEIKSEGTGAACSYEEGGARKEASGALVIMAAGRRPVSGNLNLAAAGVAETRGFITVDERMATNVPGIWAIGDVTGKVQLAHVASAQGLTAAANIAGQNARMSYDIIPACVYTNPEIAGVGKTEAQVKEAGVPYKTGNFPAAGNGRSLIMNSTGGFVKLITHGETGEILGAHIMASRATDLIGEIALAMKAEATV
ncbi:MAG: dihydrolipoyl dehydrogenase, partial [Treponema sp.]|nr:dihydrolipoyl dehydrogenase [Treponema sp.]